MGVEDWRHKSQSKKAATQTTALTFTRKNQSGSSNSLIRQVRGQILLHSSNRAGSASRVERDLGLEAGERASHAITLAIASSSLPGHHAFANLLYWRRSFVFGPYCSRTNYSHAVALCKFQVLDPGSWPARCGTHAGGHIELLRRSCITGNISLIPGTFKTRASFLLLLAPPVL